MRSLFIISAFSLFFFSVSGVHMKVQQAEDCHQCYCSSELSNLQSQIEALQAAQAEHSATEANLKSQIEGLNSELQQVQAAQQELNNKESPVSEMIVQTDEGQWETNIEGNANGNWEVLSPWNAEVNLKAPGVITCTISLQIYLYEQGNGANLAFFLDGNWFMQNAGYGMGQDMLPNYWQGFNLVQSTQASAGQHTISVQGNCRNNWSIAGGETQCWVVYNNA